jgi:hypothetical protein
LPARPAAGQTVFENCVLQEDKDWFSATVVSFDVASGKHMLLYDGEDQEDECFICLEDVKWFIFS